MTGKTPNIQCPESIQCDTAAAFIKLQREFDKLSSLVKTDPLTELFNYRHFCTALENEMERSERTGQPTTLLMIDIDHFKKVNDTSGHETGNLALKHIAQLIQQSIRKLDIACRYGGEEFSVILPSTNLLVGSQVSERIRSLIEQSPLDTSSGPLKMTISIGLAQYHHHQPKELRNIIESADKQLYAAKHAGRNQVHYETSDHSQQQVSNDEKQALHDIFKSP